jgi:hypothetical protein
VPAQFVPAHFVFGGHQGHHKGAPLLQMINKGAGDVLIGGEIDR